MIDDINLGLFVDENGDFVLPHYLYRMIMDLMKTSLDLGTLLSDDPAKLRAFKERIKADFKGSWAHLADIFTELDILQPCLCDKRERCEVCGGSRFVNSALLKSDRHTEIGIVTAKGLSTEQEAHMLQLFHDMSQVR